MFEPMLAGKLNPKKAEYPSYVQPKLDGIRCLWDGTNAWTRNQKPHKAHIHQRLRRLVLGDGIAAVDGELLILGPDGRPAKSDDFNDVQSVVTKDAELDLFNDDGLVYVIFDVIPEDRTMAFSRRTNLLDILRRHLHCLDIKNIIVLQTDFVQDVKQVEVKLEEYLKLGYEGLIWRHPDAAYHHGRTTFLRKYKKFHDAEYRIVDVVEATGKDAGTAIIECEIGPGKERFRVRPKGTMAYRAKLLAERNTLIGKMLTVRYQNLSKDRIPRFPVGVAVRDYE